MQKIFLIINVLILFSCNQNYQNQIMDSSSNQELDFLIDFNKEIIQNEEDRIDSLLSHIDVPFIKHMTGVRLFVEKKKKNHNMYYPDEGDVVFVEYSCIIFDSFENLLYDNLLDTLSFKIGHSKQMKGLNYAIKLLQIGDKAKIIIPSYLGFGMSGYGKTVPPYSTLLLNVKLLNIKE
tara:strand:+ start:23 stop:556 length:534 start_codon:yes stop_codon:yes gene_type:complete